jgi:hypothetical protein
LKRKIDRAKPIIRARRSADDADTIVHKLADYRELRNLLAHYPCWLEPVNREGVIKLEEQRTVALKLYISDKNYVWEVDTAQAIEWSELLLFVRVSIENIRREIVGAPLLKPDGSLPEQKPKDLPSPRGGAAVEQEIKHGGISQTVIPKG